MLSTPYTNYKSLVFSFLLALITCLLAQYSYSFWMELLVEYLPDDIYSRSHISPFFRLHITFVFVFPVLIYLTFLIWHKKTAALIKFSTVNMLSLMMMMIAYIKYLKSYLLQQIKLNLTVNASDIDLHEWIWSMMVLIIMMNLGIKRQWRNKLNYPSVSND